MPELDIPLFSVADAAEVAGTSVNTLRSHMHHGLIGLRKMDEAAPAGGTRLLTLRRVIQIAIMYELIRAHRQAPARAAQLAANFTDFASGSPTPDNGGKLREPGRTFGQPDFTWLVFHGDEGVGRIVRIQRTTTATELAVKFDGNGLVPGAWLPLDPIVKRVELFGEERGNNARRERRD
ncbi:hypothetical protein MKK63_20420 [Methylobacterium sp. J-088]|uniref:hypothetical protein n=1 Tax=Methylobacterium sp. J-088 TaxID=2836664 RepID=UPI001FBA13E9|nr:hypothetical protein [Methylobacterium sp. J-088]MCJ2065057.1 hypothetical protein [Methylobacterium sp. J-088]